MTDDTQSMIDRLATVALDTLERLDVGQDADCEYHVYALYDTAAERLFSADNEDDCMRFALAEVVRAVLIEARNNPTKAMIDAGYCKLEGESFQRPREPMNAWPAMIDELLGKKE